MQCNAAVSNHAPRISITPQPGPANCRWGGEKIYTNIPFWRGIPATSLPVIVAAGAESRASSPESASGGEGYVVAAGRGHARAGGRERGNVLPFLLVSSSVYCSYTPFLYCLLPPPTLISYSPSPSSYFSSSSIFFLLLLLLQFLSALCSPHFPLFASLSIPSFLLIHTSPCLFSPTAFSFVQVVVVVMGRKRLERSEVCGREGMNHRYGRDW